MKRETIFSDDRKYRYTLWREWDVNMLTGYADDLNNADRFVQFIGLNPSTADETNNDPTVRRCIDYAKRWGYGAMCMTNLFAFRATDPDVMMAHDLPIGEASFCGYEVKSIKRLGLIVDVSFKQRNDAYLCAVANAADLVVAAWGNGGSHLNRGYEVIRMLPRLQCLKITGAKQPAHPLYLKKTLTPIPFTP